MRVDQQEINHPLVAECEHTCESVPDQYQGRLRDGRWFYFRFRFGAAGLGVGATLDDAVLRSFDNMVPMEGDRYRGCFDDDQERDETFALLLDNLSQGPSQDSATLRTDSFRLR